MDISEELQAKAVEAALSGLIIVLSCRQLTDVELFDQERASGTKVYQGRLSCGHVCECAWMLSVGHVDRCLQCLDGPFATSPQVNFPVDRP